MSYADVKKLIDENDVEFIDLRFTDPRGKLQHLSMVAGVMDEDAMEEGVMFDGSSIAGWKAINESDMVLKPDQHCGYGPVRSSASADLVLRHLRPDHGRAL